MQTIHYFNITYNCDSNCKFCAANVGIVNRVNCNITPEEFEAKLTDSHVKVGDRIIINGGEPSLSPYFWDILEICKKYECIIDLYTNGHFLAFKSNVKKLLYFTPIIIRIPIFGFETEHDKLTGTMGNYEKVVSALEHLSKYANHSNFKVNVKFLLCKATVKQNYSLFNSLFNKYGNLFEYTLNPLLVSKKVIENADALLLSYTELIELSKDFIIAPEINCDLIPLCLLPIKKRNQMLNNKNYNVTKKYNDKDYSFNYLNDFNRKTCDSCKLKIYCSKFPDTYIDYFGEEEIAPL